jgi:catechol 2,3-dioxygenase-like lactoylglutathione lyase family enzyme
MAHFTGIGHLHLKVSDIERAARFYEQGLGMQRVTVKHDGKLIVLLLPDSLDVLTLSEGTLGAEIDHTSADVGAQGGIDHFGFVLAADSDLDGAVAELTAAGGSYLRHFDIAPGLMSVFMKDPDGYVFQIWRAPQPTDELTANLAPTANS